MCSTSRDACFASQLIILWKSHNIANDIQRRHELGPRSERLILEFQLLNGHEHISAVTKHDYTWPFDGKCDKYRVNDSDFINILTTIMIETFSRIDFIITQQFF
jgi:hypothetical protein